MKSQEVRLGNYHFYHIVDKLDERGEYADGTPYHFGDETGQEMEEAIELLMPLFPSYHEAKMKEMTDEDIMKWVNIGENDRPELDDYEYRLLMEGRMEGAKAMRDGEIKHVSRDNE